MEKERNQQYTVKNNRCPWKLIGNNWLLSFIFSSIFFFNVPFMHYFQMYGVVDFIYLFTEIS